jgi:hypothetical protein
MINYIDTIDYRKYQKRWKLKPEIIPTLDINSLPSK